MHEKGIYLNEWQGEGARALKEMFGLSAGKLQNLEILLASYSRDDFCGEAFILFRQKRELFEVNASHNSTDGMKGQWEPEETLVEALNHRLVNGRLGSSSGGINLFADELRFLLAELRAEGYP
ncbi:MAG: hypothetical protein GY934_16530 [Gammaproteobacteria bacterium]|nr:hypothetical protein [Gammaproteobacteria bacterium]